MSARIISGKEIAASIRADLKERVADFTARGGPVPGLATVLAGTDPASQLYVGMKTRAAKEIGIYSEQVQFEDDLKEDDLVARIRELNADDRIHAILVQLPLPDGIDEARVLAEISPEKDVDGFHPVNVGKLVLGEPDGFTPCTPRGVVEMLLRSGIDPAGKRAVVVGRSKVVGRPVSILLSRPGPGGNATVTMTHSRTADLAAHTRQADILVVAAGRRGLISADMVKPGAVIIDVGTNRVDDPTAPRGFRSVGDVDFEEVKEVAGAISPVPGGVGPMTIAMLLVNTLESAARASGIAVPT